MGASSYCCFAPGTQTLQPKSTLKQTKSTSKTTLETSLPEALLPLGAFIVILILRSVVM
jgi:hypothetical protein